LKFLDYLNLQVILNIIDIVYQMSLKLKKNLKINGTAI